MTLHKKIRAFWRNYVEIPLNCWEYGHFEFRGLTRAYDTAARRRLRSREVEVLGTDVYGHEGCPLVWNKVTAHGRFRPYYHK